MRKTKIICTLGPACDTEEAIERLILGGMNGARFNFSHGSHESHLATLTRLKNVRDRLGAAVAAILDTKGPEIRIRSFLGGAVDLVPGGSFTLTTQEVEGTPERVSVTYPELHTELSPGCRILLDDGLIELQVESISGRDIRCRVVSGGTLSNNKSLNIPDAAIPLPAVTERDREDLRFAAENDFDYVAASFVRRASDIEEIRTVLASHGGENIRVIAKIENREGVDNLEEIIDAADGIMVARGDLGVEIPAEEVPVVQKHMIKHSLAKAKMVVTATQMLDSMIRNPRPTRAEISDVANAVFDGTSCVMLSGETASGKYPFAALETMARTVETAENSIHHWRRFLEVEPLPDGSISDAICHAGCQMAMELNASAILTATQRGQTARTISRFRPGCPIAAVVMEEPVRRQLALEWGVQPFLSGSADSTDRVFSLCVECAKKEGLVSAGETVVITAGVPLGRTGSTNLIKAQIVR